ncbi:FtsX-like permease family protein [Nocardia sp. alder85J]|uniref:FtsX-like permease family protein n=1 Tax=Nocardia sp. alder85J TaxID=2862949 RepID=UPI001CD25DA8|nr:ABC transporter permease [Nocardia sp. alder85J]MCX4097885.1 ABC transporter permease [Nocardia sp. alder85J]
MYVALRDLRAARGRFLLITAVVMLVALLVSFLGGLTAGLAHRNIAALGRLRGEAVVFADTGAAPSFDSSALDAAQIAAWQRAGGRTDPVGIGRAPAARGGGAPVPVALIGVDGPSFGNRPATAGTVVLSTAAAAGLRAATGDTVTVGSGTFTVAAVEGDDWYSHSPVVWLALSDWRALDPRGGAATVLVVSGIADTAAVNAAAHTRTTSVTGARSALSSYTAEHNSLTLMTVLLFAISALVIGAFFTVWTIQRTPDVATLKALGATTGSLLRDALGQALLVLLAGVGAALAVTTAASGFVGARVPFTLTAATTVVPGATLAGLGLLGAAFALRFLVTADPLVALRQAR